MRKSIPYWAGSHFSSPSNTMISITHFPNSIPEYVRKGKDNFFPPIFGCSCCSYNGKLHRHGFYQRNVITDSATYKIYIARKICPICHKTYSQIPDFLIPYFQYSYEMIFTILTYMFLKELSYQQILISLKQQKNSTLSNQNLSFYRQRFIRFRFLIHLFFTTHPQFYHDMNFNQLTLQKFLHSLMSKLYKFSNLYQNLNIIFFETMPTYFFSPVKQD